MSVPPFLSPTRPVAQSASERLLAELSEELDRLRHSGLLRHLTTIDAGAGGRVRLNGREVVCWCSNDYLGLSAHPAVTAAAAEAAQRCGVGARASRLLSGTTRWHTELEQALAAWFGAESALVFPSGYAANLGALSALLSPDDAVFVDRFAHASLLDAARATRATFRVFRHNDVEHLVALLARATRARRRLIVTEGVFSMDGDSAPLAELAEAAEARDALVYVDDAHGAFVLGANGRGAPEAAGLPHDRFLYMATLGKALGAQGGFLIGPRVLIEWLISRARPFIYSTALAVPSAAAALAALRLLTQDPAPRQILQVRVTSLHERLKALALPRSPHAASHIVPVIVGEVPRALALAERLWAQGLWCPAIRPPTVPEGTARIRLSVTALHTEEDIEMISGTLQQVLHDSR